ncbi:MAG: PAS domain S-box protein, partial [Thermodesulfobacteriota bacterium]
MPNTAKREKAAGDITSRLRWLMFSRVVIISLLLALTAFLELKGTESFPEISSSLLFRTILLAYILSIFFLILPRRVGSIPLNIYIQSLGDILLITVLVYATGGTNSNYSTFYPLVIIYSVLFLGRRGGLIIASATGLSYALLAHLEFYRVLDPHLFREAVQGYRIGIGVLYARIVIHILSFYVVAFLASFVVEQERRIRTLLAERQSAFDQLDLLHRSIIESVDNGILTVDLGGRIKSFNRAAAAITGLTFHDIENRQLSEYFPEIPPLEALRADHERGSMAKRHFEMDFTGKQGDRMVLGGSVSPLRDAEGVMIGHIVIFQDLTAITEMRESLEKSRRLAFIGEMAANLAHEIRNPLAAISGSIQMLKGEVAQNETNTRLMQIILRGKDHLEGFLKDFLWMARPAMGAEEELDIRETIGDISESLRCVADWHEGLTIILRLSDKPLAIRANKTEIRQIFWNLML